jgi:hypothetical protein
MDVCVWQQEQHKLTREKKNLLNGPWLVLYAAESYLLRDAMMAFTKPMLLIN